MGNRTYRAVKEEYNYGEHFELPRKGVEMEVEYYDEKIVVHYLKHTESSVY